MSSTYSVNKTVVVAFLALTVLLLLSNVALLRRVASDQRDYKAMLDASEAKVGQHVAPLEGYAIDGRKVAIDWHRAPKTIVLAMSPTFHACDENWPNWAKLIQSQAGLGTQIAVVDIASNEPPLSDSFVAEHHLQQGPVLTQVAAESMKEYRFQYTPQTITIDQSGTVVSVQTGIPKASEQAAIAFSEKER